VLVSTRLKIQIESKRGNAKGYIVIYWDLCLTESKMVAMDADA
jgi:hypothetical protein